MKDQRISFADIKTFSTPRRLALYITGLADKQPDIDKSVKGPAKKIAQDDDGNWTKAAIGFSRGQGATPDDITFKDVKGTEYVFVEKHIAGKPVKEILPGMKDVITAMTFPTMMKWGTHYLNMFAQSNGWSHYSMIKSFHSRFLMLIRIGLPQVTDSWVKILNWPMQTNTKKN